MKKLIFLFGSMILILTACDIIMPEQLPRINPNDPKAAVSGFSGNINGYGTAHLMWEYSSTGSKPGYIVVVRTEDYPAERPSVGTNIFTGNSDSNNYFDTAAVPENKPYYFTLFWGESSGGKLYSGGNVIIDFTEREMVIPIANISIMFDATFDIGSGDIPSYVSVSKSIYSISKHTPATAGIDSSAIIYIPSWNMFTESRYIINAELNIEFIYVYPDNQIITLNSEVIEKDWDKEIYFNPSSYNSSELLAFYTQYTDPAFTDSTTNYQNSFEYNSVDPFEGSFTIDITNTALSWETDNLNNGIYLYSSTANSSAAYIDYNNSIFIMHYYGEEIVYDAM